MNKIKLICESDEDYFKSKINSFISNGFYYLCGQDNKYKKYDNGFEIIDMKPFTKGELFCVLIYFKVANNESIENINKEACDF